MPSSQLRRHASAILTILTLLAMLGGALPAAPVGAATSARIQDRLARTMALQFGLPRPQDVEDELDGFDVGPIDPNAAPEEILKARPFVVGDETLAILMPDRVRRPDQLDEETAKARLVAWLQLRGVDQALIDKAVKRFDDRVVKRRVPDLNLRAALLMLTGWKPYEASIAAVLDGANPSGKPYDSVRFDQTGMDGAIATLYDDPTTGTSTMLFDSAYKDEAPETLMCVVVHEALHGGGKNSAEEELFANAIDAICWAEVLGIQPDLALTGTDLVFNNNIKLIALLNSSGRSGPGAVGIATSAVGDVFVGDNDLGAYDAESIRAETESAGFYDALRNIGSDGQQTTAAQLRRYPGGKALAEEPRYDERALAVLDAGVTKVVTPALAVKLATLLGLQIAGPFREGKAKGETGGQDDLAKRPFVPTDPRLVSYSSTRKVGKPLSEEAARAALEASLTARDVDAGVASGLLAKFDDPAVQELIADPSLRAATLLLGGVATFASAVPAVLEGENADGAPLQVRFEDLRDSSPAARLSDWNGDGTPPAILVNSLLKGESPQLLASVIVEALFLHDDTLTKEEAISAATFGALAWADIVGMEPKSAAARTWGVMNRNQYLLALLNSASSDGPVGIVGAPAGVADILPGVYADATSFAEFIDGRPWGVRFDRNTSLEAPELFVQFLSLAGVEPTRSAGDVVAYDEMTLGDLDFAIAWYLTPDRVLAAARALDLGLAKR